jgi:Protein of unknown function (DUF3187)
MRAPRRLLSLSIVAVLAFAAASVARGQETEPFRTRNLSPPIVIFGLPAWETVKSEAAFGITAEVASHYRLSQRGSDQLILDGETLRTSFYYSRPVGERWSVSAELPLYRQSGGFLDNLVDAWHSTFRLPDGGRNNRGEDELFFEMSENGQPFFVLDRPDTGLGDLQLGIARRIGAGDGFVLRATAKLPTGAERILAGSGSADWAVTVLRARAVAFRGHPAGYFWGLGYLDFGLPENVRFDPKGYSGIGLLGGSWKVWQRVGLKVQLDVFSAMYRTPLEELGQNAAQASLGGWWDVSERGVLEFAVEEDLHVSTAPDVVLHVNMSWRW